MSKSWQPYAKHVLQATERIREIRERGDINQDPILYDATLRNLQTLSEATQRLPDSLKQQFPDIPWADISGFRNILVHNYLGRIDPRSVRSVIENDLAALEEAVQAMVRKADG